MSPPSDPTVPPEQQELIYAAMAEELIALIPASWNAVELKVTVETSATGVHGMSHEITSPERFREPIMPSDELTDRTYKLLALFQVHGKGWTAIRFEMRLLEVGDWRYTCHFTYG
jgi:hypothetical protein